MSLLRRLRGPAPANQVFSREECQAIASRALGMVRGPGTTRVGIVNEWTGSARWGRNRLALASDRRQVRLTIDRLLGYGSVRVEATRTDDAGLAAAIDAAEALLRSQGYYGERPEGLPPRTGIYPKPTLWSAATVALTADQRGSLAGEAVRPADAAGLWSAGYLAVGAKVDSWFGSDGEALYSARTTSQCSVTVRDQTGRGSGWAGASSYDWSAVDAKALAARARAKCEASREPVALEPGRYTVVLEPQAVGDLLELIMNWLDRLPAEMGVGPFADRTRAGFSKLGQKVVDERIDLRFDAADPLLGVPPFNDEGEPLRSVSWITRGVLTALAYDRRYAVESLDENIALPHTGAVRMTGGETGVDEMIASTKRGLLVTRFSGLRELDPASLLSTGVTRDGLWLIENGKITKPVKNFRFADSPLVLLNSVESLGKPERVFRPAAPMIVPAVKGRSFNFNRLVDAV
jgi:predicted Zn-dependent protease